jgi:hypothetical protein
MSSPACGGKIARAFYRKWRDNISRLSGLDTRVGKTQTQGGIVMSDLELVKEQSVLEQLNVVDEQYILNLYKSKIDYYWSASRSNKNAYKRYRTWAIILGSLVTLISSLSAYEFFQKPEWLHLIFSIATPVIAATLTVIGGLGQNFHWGATWRDMVVNATRLEKERDRFLATKPERRNFVKELDILNSIVLEETMNFFQRVLDSEIKPKEQSSSQG